MRDERPDVKNVHGVHGPAKSPRVKHSGAVGTADDITEHDCLLSREKVKALGTLRTLDEVAATVTLSHAG
jgi:hypothetical protein